MTHGRVQIDTFVSKALAGNALKDPHIRQLPIYLPPGYETSGKFYPVVFVLPGYSGQGIMMLNREPFGEAMDQKLDRLIAAKIMKPMIVVMVDCFTRFGGSQYVNSSATGKYETYVMNELVPYIKKHYRVEPDKAFWAVSGKSSGGYGAMYLGMRHPDVFGTVACHSGDMSFEYSLMPEFPKSMIMLEKCGGIEGFMQKFRELKKKDDISFMTIMTLGIAAAYSPNPKAKAGFDLPFDPKTGALNQKVWNKWLSFDPVNMMNHYKKALKSLNIFIDCGTRDDFNLFVGARIFTQKLKAWGIKHTYEEFDDTHMKINYRFDRSFEYISKRVGK